MENILFLNKSISERRKACITNLLQVITNAVEMKTTKRIVLLLALNKLRKRKNLFRRKMKNLLLTFALFMQKQDYYCCSGGYVSQVLQNPKTRRPRRYWMINYEQRWFEKMTARKDEPIFQELWKNEFRMLPSTFDFMVNLVEQT